MLHFCLSTHDLTTSTVKNKLKSWMKELTKIYMRVGRMRPEVGQHQTYQCRSQSTRSFWSAPRHGALE